MWLLVTIRAAGFAQPGSGFSLTFRLFSPTCAQEGCATALQRLDTCPAVLLGDFKLLRRRRLSPHRRRTSGWWASALTAGRRSWLPCRKVQISFAEVHLQHCCSLGTNGGRSSRLSLWLWSSAPPWVRSQGVSWTLHQWGAISACDAQCMSFAFVQELQNRNLVLTHQKPAFAAGDAVMLVREPHNAYDPNAVSVQVRPLHVSSLGHSVQRPKLTVVTLLKAVAARSYGIAVSALSKGKGGVSESAQSLRAERPHLLFQVQTVSAGQFHPFHTRPAHLPLTRQPQLMSDDLAPLYFCVAATDAARAHSLRPIPRDQPGRL